MMQTLDLETLSQVTGGVSKNDTLTQSLTAIQSSIKDLSSNNNNNSSSNLLLPMMMMAMNRRQGSSVVSAGGATVVSPG
jgi:hypothetical protein